MEDGRIKDDQLRSTSNVNGLSQAANGRLNHQDGYGGWCPNQTHSGNKTEPFYDQFIQVKLDMAVRLKGIATQGRYNGVEKVERYWINYTPDKKNVPLKWIFDEKTKNVKVWNFIWMNECMYLYTTHITSHGSLLSEIKHQLVKVPLAAAISPH